jgi:hypothetical protein
MAIISIPSSIGGVSIPGALIKGPLGALFGNKYNPSFLQYPRDLSSATKGHVVQFSINEIEPISYQENNDYNIVGAQKGTGNWDVLNTIFNTAANVIDTVTSVNLSLKPKKKRKIATISLYIPDTVNFTYASSYGKLSLQDVANELAGAGGGKGFNKDKYPRLSKLNSVTKLASLGLSAAESKTSKLLLASQGLAINPQEQLLFDGIDFRTYQMAFTFTPYSKEEAETVNKIIQLFKYHAAPQITTSGAGMFFIPPSTFDVDFLFNGKRNQNVNKVAESVIESVDINYSPNGWAAHDDGAPVQTTLTLNFKEIELIDKTKIKDGY